jgi:hypothetical protein
MCDLALLGIVSGCIGARVRQKDLKNLLLSRILLLLCLTKARCLRQKIRGTGVANQHKIYSKSRCSPQSVSCAKKVRRRYSKLMATTILATSKKKRMLMYNSYILVGNYSIQTSAHVLRTRSSITMNKHSCKKIESLGLYDAFLDMIIHIL